MKLLMLLFAVALGASSLWAQDIIIKKNGDEVKVKVVEITGTVIKYKKWENIDGPIYNIDKSEVFKVKYENGQSDFFGAGTETKADPVPTAVQSTAKENKLAGTKGYPTLAEPNVPYFYDAGHNSLQELEKVTFGTERVRSGAWGKHDVIILPGLVSTVTFSKKQQPQFLIRFDQAEAQPLNLCVLNTCETNDKLKRREWVMSTTGMHGKEAQHDDVLISFKNLGDGLYLVTLDKKLKPGELFFMMPGATQVYAFSYTK